MRSARSMRPKSTSVKYTIDTDSENEDDPKKFSELSSLSEASSGTEWTPPKFLRAKCKRVSFKRTHSITFLTSSSDEDDDDTVEKIVLSPKNRHNKGSKLKSKTGPNNKLKLPMLLMKKKKQEEAALLLNKKKQEEAALLLNKKKQEEAALLLNKKKQEEAVLLLNKKKQEEAVMLLNKKKQEEAVLLLNKKKQEAVMLLNKKKQEEAVLLLNKKKQEVSVIKKAEENVSDNMCSKLITESKANDNITNNEQKQNPDEPPDCPFNVGEFLVLKSDMTDHIDYPLWRIDGKSLLQKYEVFVKDGKKLHKKSFTFAGWYHKIYNLYCPAKVTVVNNSRSEHTVEYHKEEIRKEKIRTWI